jgi:putative PIG3 family NAD(P)H quinone oxidoreductase
VIAIAISRAGGPEVLTAVERPDPRPGPGDLLIRVAAAGVNRPDVMQRKGLYPPPAGASDLPGLEVSGTVVAVGAAVEGWKAGDTCCALVTGGGYATLCVAPAGQCLPVPRGVTLIEAAAIPETYFTVWTNVFDRGRLQAGESMLVHGGSSGIGTTAIQLGVARGARVFATAGTDEKCRACERLGATRAINYRRESFVEVIDEMTGGAGLDLVLDIMAGDYTARNLRALRTDGRLVQIALMSGQATVAVDLGLVMRRRLTVTGSTLRPRPVAEKAQIAAALQREIWPLLEAHTARPVIYRTFPLADAAQAHALMESSAHIGKIVLTI